MSHVGVGHRVLLLLQGVLVARLDVHLESLGIEITTGRRVLDKHEAESFGRWPRPSLSTGSVWRHVGRSVRGSKAELRGSVAVPLVATAIVMSAAVSTGWLGAVPGAVTGLAAVVAVAREWSAGAMPSTSTTTATSASSPTAVVPSTAPAAPASSARSL